MEGLGKSIANIREQKESFEGLKVNPRLITIDGPDGAGKTTIAGKVLELLKEKALKENKDPNDTVYVKYIKYLDTDSQKRLKDLTHKEGVLNDIKGKNDFEKLAKLYSARAQRSYQDHIVPLLDSGKTVILDRSELDILRGAIEWGDEKLVKTVEDYYKKGIITHGVTAGNRIFVSGEAEDLWKNLNERGEHKTHNDPKSLDEMKARLESEDKAEKNILSIPVKGEVNVVNIKNKRCEEKTESDEQISKLAKEIISQLKF